MFKRFLKMREIGALLPLIFLVILISIVNKSFYSVGNIIDMLRSATYLFIAGVGITFVLVSGGLDLSIGSQLALSGVVLGTLMVVLRLPVWLSIVITLIVGAAAGAFNGVLVTVARIPPFIATLSTYYLYRGLVFGITKGSPITPVPESLGLLDRPFLFGINNVILFMAILLVISLFVLQKTRYGRYVIATGGNEESTRLAGIKTSKIKFTTYVITGILAFIAGIFFTSRFSSVQINVGQGFELRVITAAIIGGVSLFGGFGTVLGTLFGSLFMVVLENALIMARVSPYWKQALIGIIIIIAVMIDIVRQKKLSRE